MREHRAAPVHAASTHDTVGRRRAAARPDRRATSSAPADRFPKQGSKFPWQVHQSYLRDYRALKKSDIEDDVMVFSNPAHQARVAVPAAS